MHLNWRMLQFDLLTCLPRAITYLLPKQGQLFEYFKAFASLQLGEGE